MTNKTTKQYIVINSDGELYEGYSVKSYIHKKVALNKAKRYSSYNDGQMDYYRRHITKENKHKYLKNHLFILELDFINRTMNTVLEDEMKIINKKIDMYNKIINNMVE